jgi:hypothetical protein
LQASFETALIGLVDAMCKRPSLKIQDLGTIITLALGGGVLTPEFCGRLGTALVTGCSPSHLEARMAFLRGLGSTPVTLGVVCIKKGQKVRPSADTVAGRLAEKHAGDATAIAESIREQLATREHLRRRRSNSITDTKYATALAAVLQSARTLMERQMAP